MRLVDLLPPVRIALLKQQLRQRLGVVLVNFFTAFKYQEGFCTSNICMPIACPLFLAPTGALLVMMPVGMLQF